MLAENSPCEQVLTQLLAARSALDQIGLLILSRYIDECLATGSETEIKNNIRRLFNLLLSRYSVAIHPESESEFGARESQGDNKTTVPLEF